MPEYHGGLDLNAQNEFAWRPTPDVIAKSQLRDALNTAYDETRFTLIEVGLQQGDVSPILRGFVEAFKKRVYAH